MDSISGNQASSLLKDVRILLADDHNLVLEGLIAALKSLFDIVGVARNGRDLLSEALRLQPDIILMDISMPLLSGITALSDLKRTCRASKFIVVTMHDNSNYAVEAFRLGASGYVLKSSGISELVHAITTVCKGRSYMSPEMTGEVFETLRVSPPRNDANQLKPCFTHRQREILQLVAEGHQTKVIANMLNVSLRTIQFHKGNLMSMLGVRTTAKLIRYAIDNQLLY